MSGTDEAEEIARLIAARQDAALALFRSQPLGTGVWVTIGLYIAALLACCIPPLARRRGWIKGKEATGATTVADHFIAGGSLGSFVMPLTLFATLFSGVALVGIPGEAAVTGFAALRWVFGTVFLLLGYGVWGARIRRWSEYRGGYLTGVDVVSDRFRDVELRTLVALVQIFASFLYLLSQFVAIGATAAALSNGDIPRWAAAVVLGVVMLIYETIGGMKTVAWTDAIQGLLLLIGFLFMYIIMNDDNFGGIPRAVEILSSNASTARFVEVLNRQSKWLLLPTMLGYFPFSLYGHFQQRIFAAKSEKAVRTATIFLSVASLFLVLGSVFLGVVASSFYLNTFGPQNPIPRDETFGLFMRVVMLEPGSETSVEYIFGSVILAASVAALMSTADSNLLSLSSLVSLDIVKVLPRFKDATPNQVVWVGRATSLFMTVLAILVSLTEPVLSQLLITQQQYLLQVMPAFIAALFFKKAKSRPLFIGAIFGLILNTILSFGFDNSPPAVERTIAGTIGLLLNLAVAIPLHYVDHPMLNNGNHGRPYMWERFGKPLPERLVGHKVEGFTPELINKPWGPFVAGFIALNLLGSIPWWFGGGSLNILPGGYPSWIVQLIVFYTFGHLGWAAIFYFGWLPNSKQDYDSESVSEVGREIELQEENIKRISTSSGDGDESGSVSNVDDNDHVTKKDDTAENSSAEHSLSDRVTKEKDDTAANSSAEHSISISNGEE